MRTVKVVLPAHWASALVNGDWSGLESEDPDEAARARRWCEKNPELSVLSCDGDVYISRFDGLLTNCATYICVKHAYEGDTDVADVPHRLEGGENKEDLSFQP